jgi:Domain of unknown function (DUF6894)
VVSAAVPTFYFNLRSDAFDADDTEGEDCPDIAAARRGALRAAGELIRRELARGTVALSGRIEVEDARRRRVLTLPLLDAAS